MGSIAVVLVLVSLVLVEINSSYLKVNQSLYKNYDDVEFRFWDFIAKFKKLYAIGSEEYFRRLHAFKSNLILYAKLNSLRDHHHDSAIYGITKFSDMTQDEFKEKYLSSFKFTDDTSTFPSAATNSAPPLQSTAKEIPLKFDWRTAGIITEPRNQMQCGSCWAFACVESIESMYAKKTKQLVPLSIQQMIDCSYNYSPSLLGCNGGNTCSAFDWALKTKTVFVPESTYPYANKVQQCKVLCTANETKGPTVADYSCNKFTDSELQMIARIYMVGPLTVAVDASNWNNYQGGVIQFHCGEVPMNHAVQIVGYDLTGSIPYYIVKNSWGTDFGHDGYLYVMYGDNVCSIAEIVSTVKVT